jgi:hypothetical protein
MSFGRGTEGCHENGPVATITAPVHLGPGRASYRCRFARPNLTAAHIYSPGPSRSHRSMPPIRLWCSIRENTGLSYMRLLPILRANFPRPKLYSKKECHVAFFLSCKAVVDIQFKLFQPKSLHDLKLDCIRPASFKCDAVAPSRSFFGIASFDRLLAWVLISEVPSR